MSDSTLITNTTCEKCADVPERIRRCSTRMGKKLLAEGVRQIYNDITEKQSIFAHSEETGGIARIVEALGVNRFTAQYEHAVFGSINEDYAIVTMKLDYVHPVTDRHTKRVRLDKLFLKWLIETNPVLYVDATSSSIGSDVFSPVPPSTVLDAAMYHPSYVRRSSSHPGARKRHRIDWRSLYNFHEDSAFSVDADTESRATAGLEAHDYLPTFLLPFYDEWKKSGV